MTTRNSAPSPDGDPDEPWLIRLLRRLMPRITFDEAGFREARRIADATGRDLGEILLEKGLVSRLDIMRAKAQERGYGFADLDRIPLDPTAIKLVPIDIALPYRALPVRLDGKNLWVAIEDPPDLQSIDAIKACSGCRVIPILATPESLAAALTRAYGD